MGGAVCTPAGGSGKAAAELETHSKLAANTARNIDRQILAEKRAKKKLKLLLLGTGESGKSTVLKQMRILHDNGFTEEEVRYRRTVVYSNLINGMADLLTAMKHLNVELKGSEMEHFAAHIIKLVTDHSSAHSLVHQPSTETLTALLALWANQQLQHVFHRRNEYQLDDSVKYYLDNAERICAVDYTPSTDDILHTRVPTAGIVQVTFSYKGKHDFRVFDVGGQRSERRKWIHCFDNVDAVIFVTAISEYDQVLREDGKTNRLLESLTLFDATANSTHFQNASIILFLNKRDIFHEKLQRSNISVAFTDYDGGPDHVECVQFIQDKFKQSVVDRSKRVYVHETCATDTNQVKLVIDSCMDAVISNALSTVGVS